MGLMPFSGVTPHCVTSRCATLGMRSQCLVCAVTGGPAASDSLLVFFLLRCFPRALAFVSMATPPCQQVRRSSVVSQVACLTKAPRCSVCCLAAALALHVWGSLHCCRPLPAASHVSHLPWGYPTLHLLSAQLLLRPATLGHRMVNPCLPRQPCLLLW